MSSLTSEGCNSRKKLGLLGADQLKYSDYATDRTTGTKVVEKIRMCYDDPNAFGGEVCLGCGEWVYRLDDKGKLTPEAWRSLSIKELVEIILGQI